MHVDYPVVTGEVEEAEALEGEFQPALVKDNVDSLVHACRSRNRRELRTGADLVHIGLHALEVGSACTGLCMKQVDFRKPHDKYAGNVCGDLVHEGVVV